MTKLRILIVDDEPLARDRVRAFLQQESSVEIAGEYGNGHEAMAAIQRDHPDIVFLDVQMPGCDGLQVVAGLPADRRPVIIFVTAHDRFALDAFAVQAVDYLLKPFDQARLKLALQRATDHVRTQRAGDLGTRVENLLATLPEQRLRRLAVKTEGRVVFLQPGDIVWVEAANNYSILHLTDGQRLPLRETMSALEARLGPASFVRVNRSALVHLDQVQELRPTNHGDYVVVLRNGRQFPLSRNLQGRLEKLMPQGL